MSDYDREYEAFQIFEQVREGENSPGEADSCRREGSSEKIRPRESSWGRAAGYRSAFGESSGQGKADGKEPFSSAGFADEAPYYEIEYDSCPLPGVGRFVKRKGIPAGAPAPEQKTGSESILPVFAKSQRVEAPVRDPVREQFGQMRDIARRNQYRYYENSRFYDGKIRRENSRIFYEQGMFMKDFEDHYEKEVPFSSYFPDYQSMGYEQLRTYFTWRTRVRQGEIRETSLSYAFLYLYELLNQIGVADVKEGPGRILAFWLAVRERQGAIGKYVLRWLKDYHIYYELPWTFGEFIAQNALEAYYPELSDQEDRFESLCAISRYDLRKSSFYQEERRELIKDCFCFVFRRLEEIFGHRGLSLEQMIFRPAQNMPVWTPFKDALFYVQERALREAAWVLPGEEASSPAREGEGRRERLVKLSEREIYLCRDGSWTFYKTLTTESGKRLLGFVMKQMELHLRRLVSFKYRISPAKPDPSLEKTLLEAGIDLERETREATLAFYREATRTVVSVNPDRLRQIRREAMMTQERLAVPEEETGPGEPKGQEPGPGKAAQEPAGKEAFGQAKSPPLPGGEEEPSGLSPAFHQETLPAQAPLQENPWTELGRALTDREREALLAIWKKEGGLEQFAQGCGVMPEVLAEGINEKAMDLVGDTLLDGEFLLYEDYLEQVEEMLTAVSGRALDACGERA